MIGEVQYGGRVTDDFDKRLLNCFARVSQFTEKAWDTFHCIFLLNKNICLFVISEPNLREKKKKPQTAKLLKRNSQQNPNPKQTQTKAKAKAKATSNLCGPEHHSGQLPMVCKFSPVYMSCLFSVSLSTTPPP